MKAVRNNESCPEVSWWNYRDRNGDDTYPSEASDAAGDQRNYVVYSRYSFHGYGNGENGMNDFKHYLMMGAGIAAGFVLVSLITGTVGKGLKF